MKAQKREAERNTLPDINWKEENEVKSLTARQIKIYLRQNNLHVSGSRAALVACALDFSYTGTRNNERNSANDSDTELLSSDSEYDSDSHTSIPKTTLIWIQMTPKRMALLNIHMRYYLFQTTTSNK